MSAKKHAKSSKFAQVMKGVGITVLVLIALALVYTVASSIYALVVDVSFVDAFTSFFGVVESAPVEDVVEDVVEETTNTVSAMATISIA